MNKNLLPIHFAPLQGYTDAAYRQAHACIFGGIDTYYSPFVRVEHGEIRRKDIRDINPENNRNIHLIPQLIAPQPIMLEQIVSLFIEHNYQEADINLGCPFPMLAKRHNGAGMLPYPEEIKELLTAATEKYPQIRFSVKLRLGWENANECLVQPTDFAIKSEATNVVYPVSKVTVDSKDASKVTLTLFSELKDAATYDVTLDGITKTFVASDGKVASIGLDTATVPYATETEVKLVSKDANGVIVKEVSYPSSDSTYDFTIDTKGNGYTSGSKLYLNKVGDTAEATITYKTGKYDQNGKPEGNIGPNKVTITAVDQAVVNSFDARIDDNTKASFDKAKDTKKIAVKDPNKAVFFKIKDANGKEISSSEYAKYSVETSDKTVLMLATSSLGSKKVNVTALKSGTAYILIKKGCWICCYRNWC